MFTLTNTCFILFQFTNEYNCYFCQLLDFIEDTMFLKAIVQGSFKNGVSEWESESNHFMSECTCIESVWVN